MKFIYSPDNSHTHESVIVTINETRFHFVVEGEEVTFYADAPEWSKLPNLVGYLKPSDARALSRILDFYANTGRLPTKPEDLGFPPETEA